MNLAPTRANPGNPNPEWKAYWEDIYAKRDPTETSWFQSHPEHSLALIEQTGLGTRAGIIDIGGGTSALVDHLLEASYENIAVLDIAGTAIARVQARLGKRAGEVTWIEGDVSEHESESLYDIWHDRAVFHFLTHSSDRERYLEALNHSLKPDGQVIIATFSENGPSQCNGLDVVRYSPVTLSQALGPQLHLVETLTEEHHTPGGGLQEFVYCRFCRN
jgi:2-polyprenyl-3-methyl-5-hydroxy-6-metoxy-1,4-benzoquinol methylase